MKLSRITLNNFRSFVGKHEIVLDQVPGLYSIKGENLLDDIGSNGAGKSTILDAIYYGLTGQTARGLKGDNVKSRTARGVYGVRLEFSLGGKEYNLYRSRNPSHLKLDDREIAQESIDNLFEMPVDDMLKAMIMDQMPESLLSQTPARRLETFEALLGLEVWERAIKASRENMKVHEKDRSFKEGKLQALNRQIELSIEKVADLSAKSDGFERERTDRIELSRKARSDAEEQVAAAERKCREFETTEGVASLPASDDRIGAAETRLKETMSAKAACVAAGNQLKAGMKKAKDIIAQGKCPVCETVLGSCSIDWKKQDEDNEARLAELREEGRRLAVEEEEIGRTLDGLKAELRERERQQLEDSRAFDAARAELRTAVDLVSRVTADLAAAKEQINPYLELIEAENKSQECARAECSEMSLAIIQHESMHSANEYWVEGFKNIRLGSVEDALFALQAEANSVLHGLGMSSARVSFATQRETKQKTTSRGFFIEVFVDEEQVPIGSFSGGELQRINIALGMAFGGLMRNSHGFFPAQEFYDEPTQGLSREGTRDLIQYLHQRARDNGTTIYLIDHKGPESIPNAFTVVKDQGGSRIQTL